MPGVRTPANGAVGSAVAVVDDEGVVVDVELELDDDELDDDEEVDDVGGEGTLPPSLVIVQPSVFTK